MRCPDWLGSLYRKQVKARLCKHTEKSIMHPLRANEFEIIKTDLLGVTLSWGGNPVPLQRSHLKCLLCGEEFTRDAYPVSGIWERDYPPDETGWPTNNGERIPIYGEHRK